MTSIDLPIVPEFKDTQSRLRESLERITEAWIARAREDIPAARDLSDETLTTGLSDFLERLANTFASSLPGQSAKIYADPAARLHALTRSEIPYYTLDQVLTEYRILRFILFAVLEEKEPLGRGQRDKLLEAIDNGMTEAATEFALLRGFTAARLALDTANSEIKELGFEKTARENFVSALSHDLRNPLTAARLTAQLISLNPANSEMTRKQAHRVTRNIDRADRMATDMLDSHRIQSGERLSVDLEACDLARLLRSTVGEMKSVVGSRLEFIGPDSLVAEADSDKIRRVVENLVSNAVKYGAAVRPIRVSLIRGESFVTIDVHNHGTPIPDEDQATLFKQFRRTESAQTGAEKGWGIGLTLVRGIAEAHGGGVTLRSASGEGTTFTVKLPVTALSAKFH